MGQILASSKNAADKYENDSLTKAVFETDLYILAQTLQYMFEASQGYSLSGNQGAGTVENLSIITDSNYTTYAPSLLQAFQTLIANNSYLEVNGSSTANSIILEPRKIADINSPNGNNYSKATSLPFTYRDNLKFTFRATNTNTNATQVQITGLSGLSGAIDIVDEEGNDLVGGEISTGKFYDLVLTGTDSTQKAILKKPAISNASTTTKGISYIPNPITISHNVSDPDHDLDFTAGNFRFFDGSGQSTFDAQTGSIDDLFGTGTGMLDTGTVANTTPYYLYPVYNPTTGDAKILATATKDSPTMTLPNANGYTILGRKIGSLFTDASANIVPAEWIYEDSQYYVRYDNSIIDLNTASPATTRTALSISAPAGTQVELSCTLFDNDTATTYVLFTEENQTDVPSSTNSDISANDQGRQSGTVFRFLNSSSQLYYQSTDGALAANGLTARVRGYRDKL